ncbi:unnamed protein product [Rhizophagus irregularis]|uniref:Uncharacterized protein n=1 Tax=Rhizophagus irregularis TaxID=588596 RepID=A0A2I1ECQ2_9GLOM|nr:hypothetical protein RhiirB3_433057 [Rhizophagus irregularis]CAB5363054.1 unnamed protein product [Rhizophagus irregularis]
MRIISITFAKRVSIPTSVYTKRSIFCSLCYNHKRTYHSTPTLFNKDNKDETTTPPPPSKEEKEKVDDITQPEAPKAPSRIRRPKYKIWLVNEGKNFTDSYDRPNYLGSNIPFPMNPFFKPQPPLSDSTKEEIWLKFTQEGQTPRKIGTDYGVSLKRVEAILKLKKLEKDMDKKGITLQKNLSENIEKMLGARSFCAEPLTDTLPKVGVPNFETVDENQDFSPEDAAKILRRPTLAKIQEKEHQEELLKPFSLEENSTKDEQIMTLVGRDEKETNQRFQFKFKTVGKEQNVILRDRDGSLYKIEKELIR